MPELQGELLGLVLAQLTGAADIARCSAVSKSWAQSVQQTQHKSLHLEHSEATTCLSAQAQLRWLQSLQQQQRCVDLQHLSVTLWSSMASTQASMQGICTLAGCWPLRKVVLHGKYGLESAVALLPASVEWIDISVTLGPSEVCLSEFDRFCKLEVLKLASADFEGTEEGMLPTFFVDAQAKDLLCLAVAGWCLDCENDHNVFECLPKVQRICSRMVAQQSTLQLANDLMLLPHLHTLQLLLCNGESHFPYAVKVPANSSLACLRLTGPINTPDVYVTLTVRKIGLLFDCYDVRSVYNIASYDTLNCVPKPFD